MEGQVYLCSWKKVGKKFCLWLRKNPKLSVSSSDFESADEELAGLILGAYGDGENVREYVPPVPSVRKSSRLLDLKIVQVGGNNHLPLAGDRNVLFSKGTCRKCGGFVGERTAAPLELEYTNSRYDGGFVWQKPFRFYSETFLKLLKPKDRAAFDWRPILSRKSHSKTTKSFYEFLPRVVVPLVAVKGFDFQVVGCSACKNLRSIHSFNKESSAYHYICSADLPKPLPSCFAIGLSGAFNLCFKQERWLQLVGKIGTKGLVSDPVGVVEERWCDRNPKVTTRF